MKNAIDRYNIEIDEVKKLSAIYDYLEQHVRLDPIEYGLYELIRHQLIAAVSAMDLYFHTVVRMGIIEIFNGKRISTEKFKNHPIRVEIMMKIVDHSNRKSIITDPEELPENIISKEFLAQKKTEAYQDPTKIKDALSYIWNEPHKFQKIALEMAKIDKMIDEKSLTERLKLICTRRNQIVHENDKDLSTFVLRPISKKDVLESVEFLRKFVGAVHSLITASSCYI